VQELSVKLNVADRTYPITVKADREENLRKAAKLINEKLVALFDDFSTVDKQDALAFIALEFATQMMEQQNEVDNENLISLEIAESIDNQLQILLQSGFTKNAV
jgi:cell division protein ZapA